MITGSKVWVHPFRDEFVMMGEVVREVIGDDNLDAPNCIAAGSHVRTSAVTIPNYEYTLPSVFQR